jgi:ferredoxin-NADP reductase
MEAVETQLKYKVLSVRNLTPDTYCLRFDKNNMAFKAGQHLVLELDGDRNAREYSIYSGEQDAYLEVLIKEVQEGHLSKKLKRIAKGQEVNIYGPYGHFTLDGVRKKTHKHVFIASGTGIAPFSSFVRSNPGLDYQLLHGVKTNDEAYDKDQYESNRYIACTSRDKKGDYYGRVTDYLIDNEFDKDTLFYFCGNSQMIFDAMDILKDKGFDRQQMFAEVYF